MHSPTGIDPLFCIIVPRGTQQGFPFNRRNTLMKSSLHYRIGRRAINAKVIASFAAIAAATICLPASGATWCVDQAKVSCFHTIGSAVTAAAPGDTVNVAPGTYAEDVHIVKSLYLIGSGWQTTIIDATGLANGVFIDGTASAPNTGVSDVSVSGFTVENANLEGILAANASYVTISDNDVAHNNKALIPSAQSCPAFHPTKPTKISIAAKESISWALIIQSCRGIPLSTMLVEFC